MNVTAEIEKLVYGGDGLSRIEGQVLLTPFVLPGERIEVTAARSKGGVLRATQNPTVIQSAPERVQPRCEYFFRCGGCHYQHSNYEFQVRQKISILRETLARLGGIEYAGEIGAITAEPWFYRNRIQLHFEEGRSGFHRPGSHALCGIDHCYISSPLLVDAIHALAEAVKQPEWPRFLRSLELFTNERHLQLTIVETTRPIAARFFEWCQSLLPSFAPGAIDYTAAGHAFQISRGSFFQVNRFLVDSLVAEALGQRNGQYAVDLYAGVGLFTLPLASRFECVEAIERGGPAYRDLAANAQRVSANIAAFRGSAEEFLAGVTVRPDLLIADPPRAGLGSESVAELLRVQPSNLVLVSCDPSTLSRDAKKLLTAYEIERLTLVDLFPQTYHFETVMHLRALATR
ncbi:MAG: class I SAM-dependent RNA methyltransferase [Acidobacteriaceae bacterium]|nr:class I SAM-dependent RNA methyltransferase [Acidobacteriaceae bacterium]